MLNHILYCNEAADVLVLDLPTSISHAQATTQLISTTVAVDTPYQSSEPKDAKRDALLSKTPQDELNYHAEIQRIICAALDFLQEQWHQPQWYRPRSHILNSEGSTQPSCPDHDQDQFLLAQEESPPLMLSSLVNEVCCLSALYNLVVHNPYQSSTRILTSGCDRYIIPPRSTFLCGKIEHGLSVFQEAFTCLLPGGVFDLVLLDPPWTNRSVRRSRAYQSAEYQLVDPFGQIFPFVCAHLHKKGYLAVWITNKAMIRSQVLETCQCNGLVLAEEWIWLKITTNGEPITPLDGIWRKPYELLLVFRRDAEGEGPIRRIVVAAPDVHSRKPNLKSMFERLLPLNYNALEVFARSLTAGWWSWGDEVLKFQNEIHWH